MQQIRFILFVALAILVALFAVLNAEAMLINLVFARYQVSASIIILISVMLGSVLTVLFGLSTRVKTHFRQRETRKQMEAMQKQLDLTAKTLETVKLSEAGWKAKYEEAVKKAEQTIIDPTKNQG